MAYPIRFHKEEAEKFLAAIATGEPLLPPGGQWNIYALLAVAGACHFVASSHGPIALSPVDIASLPKEHREAREETFLRDLGTAIRYYSELTMMVKDGEFDERNEPFVQAIVYLFPVIPIIIVACAAVTARPRPEDSQLDSVSVTVSEGTTFSAMWGPSWNLWVSMKRSTFESTLIFSRESA